MSAPSHPAPSAPWTVRAAAPRDLPAVEALLAAAGLASNDVGAQFARDVAGPQYVVAAAGDGALVGVAGIELYEQGGARVGLLRSVAVHPAWRDRGIGGTLARDRLAWAREAGVDAVYLLTETAADYWRRFGFADTDRAGAPAAVRASSEWAHGCPASAVAMRRGMGDGG